MSNAARIELNPVVVTGAHRSGTTLLGDILTHAEGTWNVWEPLNRHWGLRAATTAYPYLPASEQDGELMAALRTYLATGRGRWSAKVGPGGPSHPKLHAATKTLKRRGLWLRNRSATPVVKDPFLLLGLNALQPALTHRTIVVSIRHPCSWVLSLRRMSWPAGPELNALIKQRNLYETFLSDLLPQRDWTQADDLEAGATAWACLYHMVNMQVSLGARALVVPLESFAQEPVDVMNQMFEVVGLDAPSNIADLAVRYTRSADTVTPDAAEKHLLQRNSRGLSDAWKAKLTAAEINRVREITKPVFDSFYSDWETAEAVPQLLGA